MKKIFLLLILITCTASADYYGSWEIDDYVTFTANLHSASTGAETAADGDVDLWIYEDDSATQIVDTTMDAFDAITGLYEQKVQLTAASGFEVGKHYTALIRATVGGIAGHTTHNFQILANINVQEVLNAAPTSKAQQATATVDEFETQSQADPTGFHVNVKEVNGTAQTANDNGADINAILSAITAANPTTVNTVTNSKVFTLTAGVQNDNAFRYHIISVQDATDSHWEMRTITKYIGTTRTVYLNEALTFTPENGDVVEIAKGVYFMPPKGGIFGN